MLELEAGGLDEPFVLRIVRHLRELAHQVGAANPFKVDVGKTIRTRKKPRCFWRRMLAQKHGEGDRGHHQQNPKKKGKASSYAHGRIGE